MLPIGVRTKDGSAVGETTLPTVWVEKRETKDYVIGVLEEGSCMAEIGVSLYGEGRREGL